MYSRVHAGYTFTQDDVDAGHVTNTATASALSPTGATNTSTDDVDTTIPARQGVTLDKQAGAPTGATESSTIDYTFVVTNIRKRDAARCDLNDTMVTLTGIQVDDPLVASVLCSPTTLAPGAETTSVLPRTR